jgi:hypothetical protein
MTPPEPSPPANVPEELAAVLRRCDGPQLRAVVDYARQRLHDRPPIPDAVESRHGEELVRVDDHGAYTVAVVERTGETGESRGRVAYRVKWEPDVSDEEGRYRWHYLGTVCGDADGGRND